MMRKMLALATIALITISSTVGNADTGDGPGRTFRDLTSNFHYWGDECCYCARATKMRTHQNGNPEFLALGKWWEIPLKYSREADPERPAQGIWICDPELREYLCIIFNGGV